MKQFSLRQLLPVILRMPFERVDKVRKASYDYSRSLKELIAIWGARHKMLLVSEELDDSLIHNEFYMKWYSAVTRLRISSSPKKEGGEDQMIRPTQPTSKKDDDFIHKKPVRFFLDDLISTLAGNKRTSEAMNSDDMLRVLHTKVEHFNKAFENNFVEFGYGKVSLSESLGQGKMSERQQIVLKKKLEFATKSPNSKENTPLESSKNISIKSLSPVASP
ncbi:hypothetical protein MRB53_020762 [Persea americana]|uniref:Uncharacterized protein n=1 Tax=Persea americana TaxID=3435 RepID=A0ACC2L2H9_PERAE|nr:hypothetical protein MRB53_020762 [Persea americana]